MGLPLEEIESLAWLAGPAMETGQSVLQRSVLWMITWKAATVAALGAFLPLTAFSYYRFRRQRRSEELNRIIRKLPIDEECRASFCKELRPLQFFIAVGFATVLAYLGLVALFWGSELGVVEYPSLLLGGAHLPGKNVLHQPVPEDLLKYQQGAFLVFVMAFLGSYFWAIQDIFRRYSVNNLRPGAYYSISVRMIFACIIAILVYHAADALTGGFSVMVYDSQGSGGGAGGTAASILPAVAFLIGSFPQRGLQWLQRRISIFRSDSETLGRNLPLLMIEGMTGHDELRLNELGIDNCHDLATADFVPLLFQTPYPARQLIDWLLQAKLCVLFGPEVEELRQRGFRTIVDVEHLTDEQIQRLAAGTQLTDFGLEQARAEVRRDRENEGEIDRLCKAAHAVGEYLMGDISPHGGEGGGPALSPPGPPLVRKAS